MAVTVSDLAAAAGLLLDAAGNPTGSETARLTRILSVAVSHVNRYASGAPEDVRDEAVVRFASYLFDSPTSHRGTGYASAFRNSGAASLLSSWRDRRAEAAHEGPGGSAPAPVAPSEPSGPVEVEDGAVTTAKIADGAVTAAKIADGAVSSRAIAAGAVETEAIEDAAVTARKLGNNAVTAAKLNAGSVTAAKIAPGLSIAKPIALRAYRDADDQTTGGVYSFPDAARGLPAATGPAALAVIPSHSTSTTRQHQLLFQDGKMFLRYRDGESSFYQLPWREIGGDAAQPHPPHSFAALSKTFTPSLTATGGEDWSGVLSPNVFDAHAYVFGPLTLGPPPVSATEGLQFSMTQTSEDGEIIVLSTGVLPFSSLVKLQNNATAGVVAGSNRMPTSRTFVSTRQSLVRIGVFSDSNLGTRCYFQVARTAAAADQLHSRRGTRSGRPATYRYSLNGLESGAGAWSEPVTFTAVCRLWEASA